MKILAGILTFFLAADAVAAERRTVIDTLAQAYSSDPALKAARARLEAADEELADALSAWRPGLSLSGSNRWNDNTKTGTTSTASAFVRFNQRLYAGGQTAAKIAQARSKWKAAHANLRSVEQNTLLAAATAHADVVRDRAILNCKRSNETRKKKLQQQMKEAAFKRPNSKAVMSANNLAQLRLSRSQADVIAAKRS